MSEAVHGREEGAPEPRHRRKPVNPYTRRIETEGQDSFDAERFYRLSSDKRHAIILP